MESSTALADLRLHSSGKVREMYRVFGADELIEQEVFPDEHSFWGRRGIPFTARHLQA